MGTMTVMDSDIRAEVTALAINVIIPEALRWTDTRRGQTFTLTTLNVRLLADGHLAAKAYGRPVGGGRGAYVSFPVPENPTLAGLVAEAATRAGSLWAAHRGLRWPPRGSVDRPAGSCALADRLIAVVGTGQETGVTAHGRAHLFAAVSRRIGAEHEGQETASFFQPGPDVPGLTGRVQTGGIANGHPANRDPGLRRYHAADMDGAAEGDAAGPAHLRAVEDHRAGSDEHLIADRAASQIAVRTGQHVISDREPVPGRSPQHSVLHDHAVGTDFHRAAIGAQHRTVQHATAGPHPDLAAEHRRRRYIGFRMDRRGVLAVADLHQPTVHQPPAAVRTALSPGHHPH